MIYGLARAGTLAEVIAKTNVGPVRAYYRSVGIILTQFTVPRSKQTGLPRDPIRYSRPPGLTRDTTKKRAPRKPKNWEERKWAKHVREEVRRLQGLKRKSRAPTRWKNGHAQEGAPKKTKA